ncbi:MULTISPECIES: TIGR03943 family putative permease subunit [unclassified Kitasatospora]|uniref:TIGR03943 family putative permease subunit n=1 Tax=unclassified Kitasatospora TaxID=2633591 RepID=UPI00247499A5|nr:TIGR03943 family protein [Kitasatospora sp. MAP12-44]
MRREVRAVLQVLLGAAVLHISLFSELYLRYVRKALRPYLVATGVLLVLIGLVSAVCVVRDLWRGGQHDDDHGHAHAHHGHAHGGSRIAWLLTLPVLGIFLIAPDALGAYTAQRSVDTTVKPAGAGGFPPLAATDPLPLRLADFDALALWDSNASLKGRRVELTGFATPKKDGGWYLARLTISCCAADAQTSKVEIRGVGAPPSGAWVRIVGIWQPDGPPGQGGALPVLAAQQLTGTSEPGDPYE